MDAGCVHTKERGPRVSSLGMWKVSEWNLQTEISDKIMDCSSGLMMNYDAANVPLLCVWAFLRPETINLMPK